jgi:hypothetical protein
MDRAWQAGKNQEENKLLTRSWHFKRFPHYDCSNLNANSLQRLPAFSSGQRSF